MFTELFSNLTFEDIKRYSDLSSDFNTYYAYRHVAMLKQDGKLYEEQNRKFIEAETQMKAFLSEIHNKYSKKDK